ncbi:MAG: tRNA preQ1(34) S-adenosylmethionine ribosyltransferase-isomerase QueA [Bacteroidales bacterium]|nr:tRNA preQ1(34) S-adenosylmethionine ribosyltransferase-isomerase QueA [Bacteroidales bacterium]
MKLSQFRYTLPQELIALYPTQNRDESRLFVLDRKTGEMQHRIFKDITEYFLEHDVLVFNNTKVFPARLYGNKEKTGAEIEVFLLRELNREQRLWDVLVDPARKIRIGNKLYFGENDVLVAEVIDNTTSRGRTLRFLFDGTYEEFKQTLYSLGETPLPKFINRPVEPEDNERYQTIFAKHEGAVAAPTAGLHFSRELLKKLEILGVDFAEITLHVGLGNFRSVDVEDLTKHKVDSERIRISEEAADLVNKAKENKHRICAVGTTVVRTLESSVSTSGYLKPFDGWTNKFIFPPYVFKVPDMMISNFHLPYSTLLMMVAAFGGYELLFEAYRTAVREKYRFGTYGDAMLIL